MKEYFGRYEFDYNESISKLNYNRSFKDWFDILLSACLGGISAIVVCYMINYQLKTGVEWVSVIMVLLFGFTAFLKLSYFISKLLEPTREIIKIDKKSESVQLKLAYFKKIKMDLSELSSIEYHLHKDTVGISGNIKDRFWVEIELITKTRNRVKCLHVNPSVFLQSVEIKSNLIKVSKKMVKKIAKELEIESRWKGVVDEEN